MVVPEHEASAFIQGYTQVMVQIYGPVPAKPKKGLLEILAAARASYVTDRSLLEEALRQLKSESIVIAPEVVSAIKSLEVKKWIYLKDTSAFSIFIDPSTKAAYAVFGLTDRIRNIIGGSGAVVETGLLRYQGRYVTDGIVTSVIWLGRTYKKSFIEAFADLRAQGAFHKTYLC
ncbi:MAG: hypothetical protein ACR65R_18900 [Methylomicrobium sp.]